MTLSTLDRTVVLAVSLVLGGCQIREPWGGCPYEEVEVSSDFVTPWGSTLEHDFTELRGPHLGTLSWRDGEDVITVPRAGDEVPVEAIVEVDSTSARMRVYESTEDTPSCESDTLSVEATVSFMRQEDGEIELSTPVTFMREDEWSRYIGEAEIVPVTALAPGLVPQQEFQNERITVRMEWREGAWFSATYDYSGERSGTPGTGAGVSQLVAEFTTP